MEIRQAADRDLVAMAELAGLLQADSSRAIAYLGVDVDGISNELGEIDWRAVSALAFDGGRLAGWLVGDVDPELGRVFWFGPFVAAGEWEEVASALYERCTGMLARTVSQEEMAIDVGFDRFERWATTVGFAAEEGSSALVLETVLGGPGWVTRPVADDDLTAVAALHDELFAGTHTTGTQLVIGRDHHHRRLVVEIDGMLAGYVAFERQPDGAGYLDYLGVAPRFRRSGFGCDLVKAAVAGLLEMDADPIHLTVREGNVGARALYASLGFTEERVIRPLRKGFSLA